MIKRKKIAVIGLKGLPAYGGAAAVGENIINKLKSKYDLTVYSVSSHTEQESGNYNGIRQIVFKKLPIKKINIFYYYIVSALHALFCDYDLVHLHHSDWALIMFILRLRHKVVLTSHGSPMRLGDKDFKYSKSEEIFVKLSEKYFIRLANKITSVSKELSDFLQNRYKIDINYIPNGIENNGSSKVHKDQTPISQDYVLFAAGRIIPTKGCHIFLQALQKLNFTEKVVIVGDHKQLPEYYSRLKSISDGLDVDFTGLIKEKDKLNNYIANTELFVFPSSYEAMSMMLLEVVSLQVPVICSDIPENKDIFADNEVLYFETNNVNDLAKKIQYAINNKNDMIERSKRAYKKLEEHYTWDKIAKKYEHCYDSLI